jgi:hypothetical protein
VAKTNLRKSPEVSDYFEVDPESRVEEAYVDFVPVFYVIDHRLYRREAAVSLVKHFEMGSAA